MDVRRAQFGQGQLAYSHRRWFQLRIVRDDHHIVSGNRYIHFEEVSADGDGIFERRKAVFRQHGARAAMAVNQNGRRRHAISESRAACSRTTGRGRGL